MVLLKLKNVLQNLISHFILNPTVCCLRCMIMVKWNGDTVTVLMNGNVIFSKVGLTTKANSKTIYITPNMDSVKLVMYAENLGSIPPNTGLLIVNDGKKRYDVRFTADLKTNAAIVLRRKKNE